MGRQRSEGGTERWKEQGCPKSRDQSLAELLVILSARQASLKGMQGSSQPSIIQLLHILDALQIQKPLYEIRKQHN